MNISPSPKETIAFGREIFRATVSTDELNSVQFASMVQDLPKRSGLFVTVEGLINDTSHSMLASKVDRVVQCTPTVYWEEQNLCNDGPPREPRQLGECRDAQQIGELVEQTFSDYSNHYSDDDEIAPIVNLVSAYTEWALDSLDKAHHRFVTVPRQEEVKSFALVRQEELSTEILLAGTPLQHRRAGYYAELLAALRDDSRIRGLGPIRISTQITNLEVQRSWARFGLVPVKISSMLHVWR